MLTYLRKYHIAWIGILIAVLSGGKSIVHNLSWLFNKLSFLWQDAWLTVFIVSSAFSVVYFVLIKVDDVRKQRQQERQEILDKLKNHDDRLTKHLLTFMEQDKFLLRHIQEIQSHLGLPKSNDQEVFKN